MPLPHRVTDLAGFDLLLSIARLGSIGLAAKEHGMSQPAASARIRQLEAAIGDAVIERSARGSRLTPTGALVADWARPVVEAATALDTGLAALRAERSTHLRIAASLTVAEYLVPRWLATLRASDPAIAVALTADNSTEVAKGVLDGTVDLGFVEGPNVPPGLRAATVARDELVLVVNRQHRWARRARSIRPDELARTPLVSREHGSGTRQVIEEALRAHARHEPVAPLVELSSTTAIKAAVLEGIGPAILSSRAVVEELAAGTLHRVGVRDLDLSRPLRAVWPRGHALRGPAAHFAAIAAKHHR
jgi:molybdate transport repressor ModE-like protein